MPLSSPIFRRAPKHQGAIQIDAYTPATRDDGLWGIGSRIATQTGEAKHICTAKLAGAVPAKYYPRWTITQSVTL